MPLIDHLQSLILDLPPSCVEFCPHNERYAVVGTYNLEKEEPVQELSNQKSQQRNGSLILLQIEIDGLYVQYSTSVICSASIDSLKTFARINKKS